MPRPRLPVPVGQRFGHLVVLRAAPSRGKRSESCWLCRCDCGVEKGMRASNLRSGHTKSCGCHKGEGAGCPSKHGHASHVKQRHPLYCTWESMRRRCCNPKVAGYKYYGGRGIEHGGPVTVCDRWDDFELFLEDMGPKPTPEHSIDRINNDGNYESGNCKWSTQSEQNRNQRKRAPCDPEPELIRR